jgi:hypothetical protein
MEEKHEQLLRRGGFAEYRKIHASYVAFIESNDEGLEALKRALSLNWYEQAELSCLTGLWGCRKVPAGQSLSHQNAKSEAAN